MAQRRTSATRLRTRWRWRRILAWTAAAVLAAAAWLIWPFWQLSGQFATHPVLQPSRLYGRAPELRAGSPGRPADLVRELEAMAYRPAGKGRLIPGTYRSGDRSVEVFRRRFSSPRGTTGGDRLRVTYAEGAIQALEIDDRGVATAYLDPPLVASFYGPDLRERRPVGLDELPEDLVLSVMAIEDAEFLDHPGFSPKSILRAAWSNLRSGEVREGGSTLTQQLVKNLYVGNERTLLRKVRELILAVMIEMRYDKRAVIRAYLNEIFWGRSGSVNLMGVGAAAWAYLGKQPAQLTLGESAMLAGMIQSPTYFSPLTHPDRARERRDVVLGRLVQLNWVDEARARAAAQEPIAAARGPWIARQAPYFADAMAAEAAERFGLPELRDKGYVLHSTLVPADQEHAEAAVGWGVEALEKGWEKNTKTRSPLQAALVSIDPRDGSILAYVGGRDYGASQFDRVADARRQPGSAFKPVVYAAAFRDHAAHPATRLDDSPFTRVDHGREWSPQNSDGRYRGPVSARYALEQSLNVPTARLALDTGLEKVIALAHAMGIGGRIEPFPALALGSMDVTPREMATVFGTLANGGLRPSLHGLVAVFDRQGTRIEGKAVAPPERVLGEDVAFVVDSVLQGVLDRGTAVSARNQGVADPLAGKTGTSNDRRDSWFAGFSPDRATLVWVGYDDNAQTHLSGTRAALPIWSRFIVKVRPAGGFATFAEPDGVLEAWIDPTTGGLATTRCEMVTREVFLKDFFPDRLCPDHSGFWARPLDQPEGVEPPKTHPFRRWLRMLRGERDDEP